MKHVRIRLKNCYGIKRLEYDFDFSQYSAYAVYAPNGVMKSSLAHVFKDIEKGSESADRMFPTRVSNRVVEDESGVELPMNSVFVVTPYDGDQEHPAATATLLVQEKLRKEYEALNKEVNAAKDAFLKKMKEVSGNSKKNLEREISWTFTSKDKDFWTALGRLKSEVNSQRDAPWSNVEYDRLFDDKVLPLLKSEKIQQSLDKYIAHYNELLEKSTYFRKGIFSYYNAEKIAKTLADNGFFDAKHTIRLNAKDSVEITTKGQLEKLIQGELDSISSDLQLKKTFGEIKVQLEKNENVRAFQTYLEERPELLSQLKNIDALRQDVWKSYFKSESIQFNALLELREKSEVRRREIEEAARQERTLWHRVIEVFNERFVVPFKLVAQNLTEVSLGQDNLLVLGFIFRDGEDETDTVRSKLLEVLSQGERKALYLLNIIFEIKARQKAGQETLFVFDDVADSFDYRNKYAIIEYLRGITDESKFKQIILTHNFDFFRTLTGRCAHRSRCLMAVKTSTGITLEPAEGINNIFTNDWKKRFFDDPKKRIASIPFMRNLFEYTRGTSDPDFLTLTSLLHWKSDSMSIPQATLDQIYTRLFNGSGQTWNNPTGLILDMIFDEAAKCLTASDGLNFENKIVMSIAARLAAERFMVSKIQDPAFLAGIESNQNFQLLKRYRSQFPSDVAIETLDRVALMTPENIHLNSFMYEPIVDMSDIHLRKLYRDALALK